MTPSSIAPLPFSMDEDPGVCCRGLCGLGLVVAWLSGPSPEEDHEALTLAQELSHPFSLAYALTLLPGSINSAGRGRQPKSGQRQLIALSTEQGFPFCWRMGTILQGWALAEQGQGEEGIAQMRQGLAAYRATGAELWRPYFLALLAEAYGKVGQPEEGLACWPRRWLWWTKMGSVSTRRSCIGCKGELTLASV